MSLKNVIGNETYNSFLNVCSVICEDKYYFETGWRITDDNIVITIAMDDDGKDELYDGRVRALISIVREFGRVKDIDFIKSHLDAEITVSKLWSVKDDKVSRVVRKQDEKSVIKRAMMRVYDRVDVVKEIYCDSEIKPKWLDRIKNQGFDENRRLVICYKTHKNVLNEEKSHDYEVMLKFMKKVQTYFEGTEDVEGKLYCELNKIVIKFKYLKKSIITVM